MDANELDIAEYQAAQDTYLHYDAFRWQAGSILIAGVFVLWGFLITANFDATTWARSYGIAALAVSALMSVWLLFAQHYRNIYRFKLHRIWELERKLGFEQHLRFVQRDGPARYIVRGPRGHYLDWSMFGVASIGTLVLGVLRNPFPFSVWLLVPLPVIVVPLIWVAHSEHKTSEYLNSMDLETLVAADKARLTR